MNTKIDLHDSSVAKISRSGSEITIHFQPAYLHKSEGRPGIDAGAGWVQEAWLILADASIIGSVPNLPCWISDGELVIGKERHHSCFPAPFVSPAHIELSLTFVTEDAVVISGQRARLELLGEPRYVEEFKPQAN